MDVTAAGARALSITKAFLPATTRPIAHVPSSDVPHPGIEAVRARRAEFLAVGFKGAEEPTDAAPHELKVP